MLCQLRGNFTLIPIAVVCPSSKSPPIYQIVLTTPRARNLREVLSNAETMDPTFFVRPRPKRSILSVPPSKKRKITSAVEEINFDFDARADFLTGFHKRKVQRAKQAQEEAVKKAKEERVVMRKQVRFTHAPFPFTEKLEGNLENAN
jgi:hypothetical protein